VWRALREHDEGIVSGCKVNRLIDGLCGEDLPTIDLAHVDHPGDYATPNSYQLRDGTWGS
jgi:hypothetical protein